MGIKLCDISKEFLLNHCMLHIFVFFLSSADCLALPMDELIMESAVSIHRYCISSPSLEQVFWKLVSEFTLVV